MLIPSFRFFIVPFAAACVLVALAMTQQRIGQITAEGVTVSVPHIQACHLGANSPAPTCMAPAG